MATIRGARRAPGPTTERARGTKTKPTSFPTPDPIVLPRPFPRWVRPLLHPSGTVLTDDKLLRSRRGGRLGPGGLLLVAALSSGCVDPEFIKERYVEAYRLASGSMAPTIHTGDLILVNKAAYRGRDPARGELVVFDYPVDESRRFVMRIVAIGGDVVYVQGRRVYVGCRPPQVGCQAVEEPWAVDPAGVSQGSFGPVQVPPGAYFVLGDNRDNSNDSRYWGFVKREQIHGKVFFVYWSWDAAEKRVRWEQLGLLRS